MNWKIAEKAIYISFLRISPGKESDFIKRNLDSTLIKENKITYYKCIGKYDLIEFLEISNLKEEFIYKTDPALLEIGSIPCFSWEDVSLSKNFFEWIKKDPFLFLILLKIDDKIFKKLKADGEKSVIEALRELSSDLSIHIGLGYNEIIGFYRTSDLKSIFELIEKIRSLTILNVPAFVDTITFPLISHKEIIECEKYDKIVGNLNVITKISCHPYVEKTIFKDLMQNSQYGAIKVNDILDENDLIIEWPETMSGAEIIKNLIKFRTKWSQEAGLYSTQTLLQNHRTSISGPTTSEPITNLPVPFQINLANIQQIQRNLDYDNFDTFFILNYVQDYLTKWNSIFSCPNYSASFHDMLRFSFIIEARLNEYHDLLLKFEKLKKNSATDNLFDLKAEIASLGGYIIRLIETVNIGFVQRYIGLETSSSIGPNILPGVLGGLNRVIQAASLIPDYLYTSSKKSEYKYPWLGYIFFKQIYGYQIVSEGEAISIPESAILYPLLPETTWMTLTHEVAHGFYFRLKLHKSKKLQNYIKEIKSIAAEKLKHNPINDIDAIDWDGETWELFAHWLDFKYIYDSDFNFYMQNVWSSWAQVPRVFQQIRVYLTRSMLIYISNNYDAYFASVQESRQPEFLETALEKIEHFLKKYNFNYLKDTDVSEKEKKKIFNKTCFFAFILRFFEEEIDLKKTFPKLRRNLKTEFYVDQLLLGKVIHEPIKNPILVLRELLRRSEKPTDLKTNIAFIYSFSNTFKIYNKIDTIKPNSLRKKIKSVIS